MNRNATRQHTVGVIGGSGYIGAELLRYLAIHPALEVAWVTANSRVGERIDEALPNLRGFFDGEFLSLDAGLGALDGVDAVLVALPHNKSQEVIPELLKRAPRLKVVDMGGDFRTPDPRGYASFYGREHSEPELLERFVYGFTELQREALDTAQLVANPGCFATSLVVALTPLARAGKLSGDVFATAVTGSSGSGNVPKPTTHHPERFANFRSYKTLTHQHLLEVNAFVGSHAKREFQLRFVPQSGPFARGIFTTVFVPGAAEDDLEELYREVYDDEPLFTVRRGSPDLRLVAGTPRAEVGLAADGGCGVVFVTLDNLGKGAAGQALQNLNRMLALEETTGLDLPGGFV